MFTIRFGINVMNDTIGSFLVNDMEEYRLLLVSRYFS